MTHKQYIFFSAPRRPLTGDRRGAVRIAQLVFFFFACTAGTFSQDPAASPQPLPPDWPAVEIRLSRQIAEGTAEEKRDALFEIRNLRSEIASVIALPALTDNDEMVRATAASSVVFLPGPQAAAALIPLLTDRAEFVRREAAYALGKTGDTSAVGPLLAMLRSEKEIEGKTAAVIGLGEIGGVGAVPALTEILRARARGEDEFLRRSAARSIGQIAQTIVTGRSRALTPQNFLPEKFKESDSDAGLAERYPVFREAADAAASVLRSRRESDDTRREAAFALGAIGGDASISVLTSAASSPDPYLAEISREALLKIRKN